MAVDLSGVYAAIVTPFDNNGNLACDQLTGLLRHLARNGCHGVLLAGTTGEGPSLSVEERITLFKTASHSDTNLRMFAGTGAASLSDAIALTKAAFDNGCLAPVVAPPFFYRGAPDEGLYAYYAAILHQAVPSDGAILLYHNPAVIGVPLSLDLVQRLRDGFPDQVIGIKDSTSDWEYTDSLLDALPDFQILVGDDRKLARALESGAVGAITGMCNVFPELLVSVFDRYHKQAPLDEAQERLSNARNQFDDIARIPVTKLLLRAGEIINTDFVRPPLAPLPEAQYDIVQRRFHLSLPHPLDPDSP
jgi:4-hydroxy-tetrahydrodipicolinate synthase